ncbi:MAG TPA: transporter substrate-binding domain-containing protein [Dongiaceae bacterium]
MSARTLISLLVLAILVIAGIIYMNKGGDEAQQAATPPAATTDQAAGTTPPSDTAAAPATTTASSGTTDQTQTAAVPAATPLTALAGKTIKVATEGAYPPFNFVDANGALQGFDVEIANAICAKMQVTCEVVKQDWDGMIPGLLAKKYDTIIASMSITPERKEKISFTGKYYNTPSVIVGASNATIALGADGNPTPDSMAGKKIGVQRATVHENFARETFPGAEVVVYDTADNANLDLTGGRLDARLDDILVLEDQVIKPNGDKFKVFGKGWSGGIFGEGAGIGVRKEDEQLRTAIDEAIKAIRADGTYKTINDKYFTFDVYGGEGS